MSLDRAEEFICITTPHLHHFQHAKPCHQAGEHVLYENAVTVNVAEAEILAKTAKEKSVFFNGSGLDSVLPSICCNQDKY